jgi:hypothetical protein
VRVVLVIGFALQAAVGCAPTGAELTRTAAIESAKMKAENERVGAAYLDAHFLEAHEEYTPQSRRTPPPAQSSTCPTAAVGTAAAYAAALAGAAFSRSHDLPLH